MIDLTKIKNAIKEDIIALFQAILEDDRIGINPKVNINTLKDSRLHDEVSVNIRDNIFVFQYNDYLQYVESGRRPFAKKVPIDALKDWAKRKGIPTDNKVLYAIQNSIFVYGIKARPIFPTFENELDNLWENDWSNKIINLIYQELDKYFK